MKNIFLSSFSFFSPVPPDTLCQQIQIQKLLCSLFRGKCNARFWFDLKILVDSSLGDRCESSKQSSLRGKADSIVYGSGTSGYGADDNRLNGLHHSTG